MNFKGLAILAVTVFSSLVLAAPISAQGVIVPIICDIRPVGLGRCRGRHLSRMFCP